MSWFLQFRRARNSTLRIALLLNFILILLLIIWNKPTWIDASIHEVSRFDASNLDLTTPKAKEDFCKSHKWSRYISKNPQHPRRVYDLVMINTEVEWLEIRLNTTYSQVDYFVIVESPKTFTTRDKPLIVKKHLDKLIAYRDKIIYHQLEIPRDFHSERANPAWAWEDLQRNAMYDQVLVRLKDEQAPVRGDVIIVADVDELLRPETIIILKTCEFPARLNLRSQFYYYSFQFRHRGKQWAHPQATYYRGSRTILPVNLRNSDGGIQLLVKLDTADLWNAGWHCSSCFATMEELLIKLSSFSHQWMNAKKYRNRDRIASYIREGKDLWDRESEVFDKINNNQDIPEIVLNHKERFTHLLDRDGPQAGFRDYP